MTDHVQLDQPDQPDQPDEEQSLVPCPACGCLNTPGHYFCNECGGSLPTLEEIAEAAKAEAEADSEPEQEAEAASPPRWKSIGRSRFWYGNVFLLILLGLCCGLIIMRLSAPHQFRRLAQTLWLPGRKVLLPLLDAVPSRFIDRAFGIDPTATPDADLSTPTPTGQPEPTPAPGGAQVVVGGWSTVNIRSGPGTGYEIIGKASPGDHYLATGILVDGSWCRLEFEGQPAWIACYLVHVRLLRDDEVPYVTQWAVDGS